MIKTLVLVSFIFSSFAVQRDSTKADSMAINSTKTDINIIDTSSTVMDSVLEISPDSVPPAPRKAKTKPAKILIPPVVENNAFFVGEKLFFDISYGFIHAGTATMEVKEEKIINNKPVYHIQTTARSAAGFSWIYKVEDVIDSYVDRYGLFSWKFAKRLREGGYKADISVDYSPQDSIADVSFTRYKRRMRVVNKENYQVKTPPFVFDVLAAFYYSRTQDLEVGKSITIANHDNKKVYELEVKVYSKETIETDAGRFRCLFIEPLLKGEGIFKKKGRLKVWLSDDQYKIPVMMKSEVIVGHITTELDRIEGIPYEIPSLLTSNE
jgi:hypothetical protein